jgi:hypothetical protein
MSGVDARTVDDPEEFDHRIADVNGIRMQYVEEGEGPLVILVHGQTHCPDGIDSYAITHLVGESLA